MEESKLRKKCMLCKVYKRELNEDFVCCAWFMDNVICGNQKDTSNCDAFESIEE